MSGMCHCPAMIFW